MKQGSTDDPFAEDSADDGAGKAHADSDGSPTDTDPSDTAAQSVADSLHENQPRSLPYIHSRDGVKDGRKQRPVFLRDHIEDGIDELLIQMEEEFGENVYKTDVTEAAMAIAQENPELVYAKLSEWGYGWD